MAQVCPHCKSADLAALFASYECLSCGRHSTGDGRKILPDSLCIEPNHSVALEQYGWPYEDQEPSRLRGVEIRNVQWGDTLKQAEPATVPVPETHGWWDA